MKQYIQAIDFLRFLAILAVLLIHTTTRTLEAAGYDLAKFPFTLFLNQAARFAVPLFFIISGFLLEINVSEKFDYLTYYKKRFTRILLPYLFWSLIYYLFVYNQSQENFLTVILTGNASYQLYFIPTLCVFYLFFPLLHKIYRYLTSLPALALLGVTQVWLMNQDYFVKQFTFAEPLRILLLSYFFFIIGMAAAGHKEKIMAVTGKIKYALLLFLPLNIYYIFNEGYSRYLKTYNIGAFYSQWRPDVLIYTIILGITLFYLYEKRKFYSKIIENLSGLSFFVFFVHVIILENAWSFFAKDLFGLLNYSAAGRIIFDPIFFLTVTLGSFLSAYLLHKIPHLYRITG